MTIALVLGEKNTEVLFMELTCEKAIKEFDEYVGLGNYDQAMRHVLSRGAYLFSSDNASAGKHTADTILTKNGYHRDLVSRKNRSVL